MSLPDTSDHRAIELRASIAHRHRETEKLFGLIDSGTMPDIVTWAKLDLERLNKRIERQRDELARLESR